MRVGSESTCSRITGTFLSFSTGAAIELRVALLLEIVVAAIGRRSAAAGAAAASAAAAKAWKLERHPDRAGDGALFPGVAVEVHHRGLAAENAAAGRGDDGREPVGAGDRNGVAV